MLHTSRHFRRLRRFFEREGGFALPLALSTMVGLGALATASVAYTSTNYGLSKRTDADQRALALAEAGLNYAYSTLYASTAPTMDTAVPGQAAAVTIAIDGGTATYYGTLSGSRWTLVGIGRVPNPTGPGAADVVRRVSGGASIGSARRGTANNAVWNYIYVDDPTFTTELGNSVDINVPLYTSGNLRLSNSSQVSGYALQVKGTLDLLNSSHVGEAGRKVHDVHVRGGCRLNGVGPYVTPCGPTHRVYADVSDATTESFTKPPVDMASWYANAMPGPRHGCTTGSFPGGFDNDLLYNNSRPAVDLLPTTGYDCRVYDAQNNLVGQITWNPATKALQIHGTIFFDGPILFRNSNFGIYSGRGTIYSSGNITFANSATLCGDPECDADWDATRNLLAFVSGANVSTANSTRFQGAVYAVNDYSEASSSTVWGPIIARRVTFANSSVNHYVPIGTLMPGMPASGEDVVTITNEPGSWGG